MKRIIAAVLLIVLIFILYVAENSFSDGFISKMQSDTKYCRELYDIDSGACAKKSKALKDKWFENTAGVSFFINHHLIDEISSQMAALPVYAENDRTMFLSACARIMQLLEQIQIDQHISTDSFY